MYNGVLNVYKEKGFTSFDVIAKLRGILHQKKIGHTGTLDPDAEGVLVVCLGNATKLCDILTDKDKSYVATMLLGKTSDTEDFSGKILSERAVDVTEEDVIDAIKSFVGTYAQVPPMYSAIKVNGKKLYELAREGKEIERTPRQVVIHSIEILDIKLPYVTFQVSCGKGTYIRSLCRDIGEKLSCGALMYSLVRDCVNATETGKVFNKEDALTLSQIEEFVSTDEISPYILPTDSMFPNYHKVQVCGEGCKKLANGNFLHTNDFIVLGEDAVKQKQLAFSGSRILVYREDNNFAAVYEYYEEKRLWKAWKMFL